MGSNNLVVKGWKERAQKVGVSLAYLCGVGGIDTATLQRWKTKVPQSVRAFSDIEDELKRLEDEKAHETTKADLIKSVNEGK